MAFARRYPSRRDQGEGMIPDAPVNAVIQTCPEGIRHEVIDNRHMPTVAECALMIARDNDCKITVHSDDREYMIHPRYGVDDVLSVLNCPSDRVICVRADGSYLVARDSCLQTVAEQAIEVAASIPTRQQITVDYDYGCHTVTAGCAVDDVAQALEALQQQPLQVAA